MKATIFKGEGDIAVEEREKPSVNESTEAIVRVVRAAVCGSDLHFYRGNSEHPEGAIGHEFIGIVDEIGEDVSEVSKGDFVIAPFAFSDNTCANCNAGFQTNCVNGGVFGYGNGADGGQSEYVRVPEAGGTLVTVPKDDYSDETLADLLALCDVMGTGYHAAVSANVQEGDTVAVVGDGAVGLSGILSAKMLGAETVISLGSTHESRNELAREWGADEVITVRGEEAVEKVMTLTDDVGVDAVLECVGSEGANETAFAVARAGAVVGRVGLPHGVDIDAEGTFYQNVGMRGGPAPTREYIPELLDAVLNGEVHPGQVFDFETDIDGVPEAYEKMHNRDAIKAIVKVSEL